MSFQLKLLLAMMLLVAGVTGATLYVTQQKVQATYFKLFQDQFDAERTFFAAQQDNRLSPARESCQELAKSPAFQKALSSGDSGRIYEIATNYLMQPNSRQNPNGGRRNPVASGNVAALVRSPQTFFRILNASGEILRVPGTRLGPLREASRKRIESQLAAVQQAMETLEQQPVGYLTREKQDGTPQLLEVIVTKVSDSDTGKTLGAVVLGVAFLENSERAMNNLSQGEIQSGIWLDKQLHSKTVSDEGSAEFAKLIATEVDEAGNPKRYDFNLNVGGVPRRVFFRLLNPNSPFPPAYQVALYSLSGAIKAQRDLRAQILVFGSVALAATLALSLIMAHGLSIPLRELVKGTTAIREGNFKVKVPVRSRDEIGRLATSFNEMADGLNQKELYRTILNMVADEKVASALVNGQLALGGEVREISVLFCDIRGFTALTENMSPEQVIEMLNEHMTALTRIVKEHNGVLDKFVGDLLMAIFGAPVSNETDTLNAARCAMRLIQERARLNETSQHQLKIGIGIASGKVVAGCMGSVDRLNYTVLGERVNLASRLCSQAKPGQVVIDQTTRDKLGPVASTAPLPALNLKGFKENVVAHELTAIHSWELKLEAE